VIKKYNRQLAQRRARAGLRTEGSLSQVASGPPVVRPDGTGPGRGAGGLRRGKLGGLRASRSQWQEATAERWDRPDAASD
jgi:hypothetical protein